MNPTSENKNNLAVPRLASCAFLSREDSSGRARSFEEIVMRAIDNGCFYSVQISAAEVAEFKTMWPCSGMPDKPLWAQFDKRNGDLVDMRPSNWEEKGASGDAMVALIADGQAYAKKRLSIP